MSIGNYFNRNQHFKNSWTHWKETGEVQIEPWMENCFIQVGNFEESVKRVYSVIDACEIPLCQFDWVAPIDGVAVEVPDIFWKLTSDTIEMELKSRCTNIGELTCDPFPIGKRFFLHFERGLEADITIQERHENHYVCFGTITDYVERAQRIDIICDSDGIGVACFNKRTFTPWQTLMRSVPNPIPRRKWLPYEVIRLEHDLRPETEYQILRLPYLLGTDEADGTKSQRKSSHCQRKNQ